MKRLLSLLVVILAFPWFASAAAPLRSGQPYAEATLCATADVLMCEDFNYPGNFTAVGDPGTTTWDNPGLVSGNYNDVFGASGRRINTATTYLAKPQGAMPSDSQADHVWVANWDPALGAQAHGSTWGRMRNAGGDFANGTAPTKDLYFRFQIYWTSDWAWPGDPKTHCYNYGAGNPVDNKILFLYPPQMLSPTDAAYDAGPYTHSGVWDSQNNCRYADALAFRVGDAGSGNGFEFFPMCNQCSLNPTYMDYQPFQSPQVFRNPSDTPTLGNIFRFNVNRWYTVEFRYRLSVAAGQTNGTIEAWIDGTQIYSASNLATCGFGTPSDDCSGLGQIYLSAYHNSGDGTNWDGQQVMDNLVISRSYIGPPGSGSPAPPNAPTNFRITQVFRTLWSLLF